MKIVGIDLAENAGLAICDYVNPAQIQCTYLTGLPHEQMLQLSNYINLNEQNIICIEDFVYFGLNAKTSASLLKRLGYFQYTLEALSQTVILIKPNAARKWLDTIEFNDKLKPKERVYKYLKQQIINDNNIKITNDITDAIALVITQQNLALDTLQMRML